MFRVLNLLGPRLRLSVSHLGGVGFFPGGILQMR